jgi:hypothetical protein
LAFRKPSKYASGKPCSLIFWQIFAKITRFENKNLKSKTKQKNSKPKKTDQKSKNTKNPAQIAGFLLGGYFLPRF